MKAIVTGANGTLGRVLSQHLEAHNWQVMSWERGSYPVGDWEAGEVLLERHEPHAIFHLAVASEPTGIKNESWLINVEWTRWLAAQAARFDALFVFTSSVQVWTDDTPGPFTPQSETDASEGHGYEKRQGELAALEVNPDAIVTRLGWQIGHTTSGRQMFDHIERQIKEGGELSASRQWYPACSFLEDTATALLRLAAMPGDVYLLDSNEKWTYYEIAQAMRETYGKAWRIEPTDELEYDQRMQDPRSQMPSLATRLPALNKS